MVYARSRPWPFSVACCRCASLRKIKQAEVNASIRLKFIIR